MVERVRGNCISNLSHWQSYGVHGAMPSAAASLPFLRGAGFSFPEVATGAMKHRPNAPFVMSGIWGRRAQPNKPVNLTRNGVRQSAGKVHCVHSSSPAACRTPLR
jgi:hypothetical protein